MDAALDDAFVPVGEYDSLGRAEEHALVILAMNLSCGLGDGLGDKFVLLAEPGRAPAIEAELAAYDAEQGEVKAPEIELPKFGAGRWSTLLWATLLMAVFLWQGRSASVTEIGRSSSLALFEQGEWWRPFTALFLHADLAHLMSNLGFGIVFGVLACRSFGWIAWPSILLAGTLGNVATAWIRYPEAAQSIGASTAVFGALGLLAGYGLYLAFRLPSSSPWASVVVPLGGAFALLGMHGGGGPGIDVLAHLMGFVVGLPAGAFACWRQLRGQAGSRRGSLA